MQGRILETYKRLGGYRTFGNAITPESNAGRGGKFQVFEQASSIYWHPNVSNGVARQVKGSIRDRWRDWGWENGSLRYPTTDELTTPDQIGRFNHFEEGSIYWTPSTDAQVVKGRIKDRWANQGWETGKLGYPTTSESSTPDGVGRFNHFQNGSIYWTPNTGPQVVKGRIRDYWASRGWETGSHGYPINEEYAVDGGIHQDFQNLDIQWVEPTSQRLPTGDHTDWDGYQMQFPVIAQDERWTPQSVAREVTEHFDAYFTFKGCGQKIRVGDYCGLNTIANPAIGSAPIEVTSIAADGFSFKSLEGHPEGAGRTISFRFVSRPGTSDPTKNNVYLIVTAWGPATGASMTGPLNSETLARYSWGKFSRNLNSRLNNAGTDYLTADKSVGAAQTRSMILNDDIGLDSPVVNLSDEELAWVPTSVPLIPLDGKNVPNIIPQHVVDETLKEKL
ncbi:hypothetical protein GSS87_02505 [Corynebacterium sp. 4HC-13]|uniref:LGFP repeat-containing protein n=1 Tax=Corynebacterium anserum TaxID=2684406 RepID=UPI001639C3A2|nr:hypothetical protein [Corynebacterium anserum]MBC2681278.1 hypothetical protein [Corynebacterium anserum]